MIKSKIAMYMLSNFDMSWSPSIVGLFLKWSGFETTIEV